MKPGVLEVRWAYLAFFLLLLIDGLVASRTVYLVRNRGDVLVPAEAPFILLFLLVVQVLGVWLALRLKQVVRHYRVLKESYEQELDFARQVMESVAHGLTVSDEHGRFVYVNRAYAEMLGRPPEQILGRTPYDFTMPEDHARLAEARYTRELGDSNTYRTRLKRADGTPVEVLITGTPRWHGGRIVGTFAAVVPWHAELSDVLRQEGLPAR